jgi:addiction module HigA family antidote
MPMKNPPHPGEHIRLDFIEPLGLSITGAARRLGVSRQTLNNLVNCHGGISPEMAIRLSKAFGNSAAAWLAMQMNHDLAQALKNEDAIHVERLYAA